MARLILGIAGEMGSGKGTIAKHVVEERHGKAHRFSTMLRDVMDRLYIEQTRENISKLSTTLRENFGEDLMANVMLREVEHDEHDIIVVDGVRRMDDIQHLQKLSHFKFIYVDANLETRYERLKKRGEDVGDSTKTFEQFQKDEEMEPEERIRDLKNYADYVVDNNGTYMELYDQVEKIIKENLGE